LFTTFSAIEHRARRQASHQAGGTEGLVEDRPLQIFSQMQARYCLAIFVLAAATLSYQILITRFFSVVLYYHFAFAAISLAMLGLTLGATQVYRDPLRYSPERVGPEFARHAARFAVSGVGAMVVFLCVPLVIPEGYVLAALAVDSRLRYRSPKAACASRFC
jgi:hypothetical protein